MIKRRRESEVNSNFEASNSICRLVFAKKNLFNGRQCSPEKVDNSQLTI